LPEIPSLTRPSAEVEWKSLLKEFSDVLAVNEFKHRVTYETPYFELESFDKRIKGCIGNWRNTSLVALEIVGPKKYRIESTQIDLWKRFRFGTRIVSLKVDKKDNRSINIEAPYLDGSLTLKSVSARDPVRGRINLVTSRNKALVVFGTIRVLNFLALLNKTNSFEESVMQNYTNAELANLKLIYSLIFD
jgi:hypothetical protein